MIRWLGRCSQENRPGSGRRSSSAARGWASGAGQMPRRPTPSIPIQGAAFMTAARQRSPRRPIRCSVWHASSTRSRGRCEKSSRRRGRSSGRPMRRSRRRCLPVKGRASIPTPPSRCGSPTARCRDMKTQESRCQRSRPTPASSSGPGRRAIRRPSACRRGGKSCGQSWKPMKPS